MHSPEASVIVKTNDAGEIELGSHTVWLTRAGGDAYRNTAQWIASERAHQGRNFANLDRGKRRRQGRGGFRRGGQSRFQHRSGRPAADPLHLAVGQRDETGQRRSRNIVLLHLAKRDCTGRALAVQLQTVATVSQRVGWSF